MGVSGLTWMTMLSFLNMPFLSHHLGTPPLRALPCTSVAKVVRSSRPMQ